MQSGQFDWLREIEDFANRFKVIINDTNTAKPQTEKHTNAIPVTIVVDRERLSIEVELPGVRKEEIAIAVVGDDSLEISGTKPGPERTDNSQVISNERWSGTFRRRIRIPDGAAFDLEKASASYTDGVLRIQASHRNLGNASRSSIPIQ
jgi:HSP20 family molecular chaperone IbpA